MISALLMITQLMGIPNALFAWLLEQLSTIWLFILRHGSGSWLVTFARPTFVVLFLFPLGALLILSYKKIIHLRTRIALFAFFLVALSSTLFFRSTPPPITTIPCGRAQLTCLMEQNKTILIDPGALAHNGSPDQWCEFTLLPQLAQQFGRQYIDALIVLQPSARAFCAIEQLALMQTVGAVYMPHLPSYLHARSLHAYQTMRSTLDEQQIALIFLEDDAQILQLSHDRFVTICPLEKRINANGLKYKAWCVQSHNLEVSPLKLAHRLKK